MHAKHADRTELNEPSEIVIGYAFIALNTLKAGFLERVRQNAPTRELSDLGPNDYRFLPVLWRDRPNSFRVDNIIWFLNESEAYHLGSGTRKSSMSLRKQTDKDLPRRRLRTRARDGERLIHFA